MFSEQELDLLFDGLDAIASRDSLTDMFSTVLGAGLSDDREAFMEKQKEEREKRKSAQKLLEERIILLKAKLIAMRDKAFIDELEI